MISIYPACFIKDNQGYTVIFPDFNNATSFGENFNDAMEMAIDCLAGLIYETTLSRSKLPQASIENKIDLKKIATYINCPLKDVETHLVSVDAVLYAKEHFEKCVKKTITILDWQNKEGIRQGINFSKICQDALTKALIEKWQTKTLS